MAEDKTCPECGDIMELDYDYDTGESEWFCYGCHYRIPYSEEEQDGEKEVRCSRCPLGKEAGGFCNPRKLKRKAFWKWVRAQFPAAAQLVGKERK